MFEDECEEIKKEIFMHAVCHTILSESNQIRHKSLTKQQRLAFLALEQNVFTLDLSIFCQV